ncbi:MAG: ImmA/IrrE family metallo-endopeptidase [Terriglobia bacterium]|jgi:Zn-dependent peptidase ImmA (M78 family)
MTRVEVNQHVLDWAIERSGKPLGLLQRKFPKIRQWQKGGDRPTLRQLEELAKATLTPLGYFFLGAPPEEKLPIPHFHTLGDGGLARPTPNLLETVQIMERRQAWMREFLVDEGNERRSFVRSASINDESQEVARDMRRTLGLAEGWAGEYITWTEALRSLEAASEEAGIMVVVNGIVENNTRRKLDVAEFRGFVLVDDYAPLVFVNGADGKAAQMFTLAHELAHVWLGSSAAFDLRELQPANDRTELACNRVAAEFLVPEAQLRASWPALRRDAEPFQAIARQFKVSSLVGARRALDLQLISKREFLDFYGEYQEDERRAAAKKPEGGDFYATQNLRIGRRFAQAVVQAASEGRLLYRDAYQLTGLYGKTFASYAESLGTGGPE